MVCFIPSLAAASGWADVDTWSLLQGGCCHVAEEDRTVCETRAESYIKSCYICGITRGIHNVMSVCDWYFKTLQLSLAVMPLFVMLRYAPFFVALLENLNFFLALIGS